jgi:hypothetical protein
MSTKRIMLPDTAACVARARRQHERSCLRSALPPPAAAYIYIHIPGANWTRRRPRALSTQHQRSSWEERRARSRPRRRSARRRRRRTARSRSARTKCGRRAPRTPRKRSPPPPRAQRLRSARRLPQRRYVTAGGCRRVLHALFVNSHTHSLPRLSRLSRLGVASAGGGGGGRVGQ